MPELKSRWMVASKTAADGYEIVNKKSGDRLGYIDFFKPWKAWEFLPAYDTAFTTECLSDLAAFLAELNRER